MATPGGVILRPLGPEPPGFDSRPRRRTDRRTNPSQPGTRSVGGTPFMGTRGLDSRAHALGEHEVADMSRAHRSPRFLSLPNTSPISLPPRLDRLDSGYTG